MRRTLTLFTGALALAVDLWLPRWTLAQNYPPAVSQLVAAAKKQIKTTTWPRSNLDSTRTISG